MFSIPNETLTVSGNEVILKDCYFYLLYKRKGDETTQIPILMDKEYDSVTDTISASFEPTSYFTELNGGMDIQVFACSTEQDFVDEDVDIEDVALWTTFNAQISIAKSQLKNSQTIVAEDMFTKGIAEMSAYLDSAESEADDAEEFASDAEEFARGTRSDGLTVPHASTGVHDNAKDYKDLAKDWASKIGGAVESGEYSAKYYAVVSDTRSQEAEAYALGTKGGTPVPTFADKNAKDWATKTGSTVDGTNYSAKQYALNAKDSADIVEAHATAIDSIYADLTNIDAVATDIQDDDSIINTVAENIQDVNAVAESITDVNTVAGKATQITTVAGIASDVTTVAGIASDVTVVAGIASDVSAVEDIKTDVSAVASIDDDVSAVSAIKDDVSAVATIDDDVTTVATDISDVSAVASDITKVTAVADDLTNIDAVADDLTNIDNAEANALKAEGWANGTQNGTPVSSDSPYYENNAKYWADAVPDLKDAIQANSNRISNLEQEHGGYVPVNYRGTNAVPTGKAKYGLVESIVGKSRAWNQLFNKNDFGTSKTENGVTFTNNEDGSVTVVATGGATANTRIYLGDVDIIANHSYLIAGCPNGASSSTYGISNNYTTAFEDYNGGVIGSINTSRSIRFEILVKSGCVISTPIKFNPILRDLTLIFPEGVPATVAEAVALCPSILDYDAYGYSLVDTVVSGVVSKGVNLWDEEWESGDINVDDGQKRANSERCRSKNFIEVEPLRTYYTKTEYPNTTICCYDADGNWVSSEYQSGYFSGQNTTFTTPAWCHKVMLYYNGNTYNDDICLNISSSLNGTYKPYVEPSTLTLPTSVTLRSAGSVAEVYDLETGEKSNPLGEYTFTGNESWSSYGTGFLAIVSVTDIPKSLTSSEVPNIICPPLLPASRSDIASDGKSGIAVTDNGGGTMSIIVSDYSGLTVGKTLYYELAIPDDPTQLTQVIDNTILTEGGGTINTIQTQTPVIDNSLDVGYLAL